MNLENILYRRQVTLELLELPWSPVNAVNTGVFQGVNLINYFPALNFQIIHLVPPHILYSYEELLIFINFAQKISQD